MGNKNKSLKLGKDITQHSPQLVQEMSQKLAKFLGVYPEFTEKNILSDLHMAEQNEALRLIASVYREGIIPEGEAECFLIRSIYVEYKIYNVHRAVRVRYKYPPRKPVKIFFLKNDVEIELKGVDGVIKALKPFLEMRSPALTIGTWDRLLYASHNSIIGECMALSYKKVWRRLMQTEVQDIFEYLASDKVNSFDFFTQIASFEARPITPFTKMKLDLTIDEMLRYSPEFSRNVEIKFIALSKHLAKIYHAENTSKDEKIFENYFKSSFKNWENTLNNMGFKSDEYVPIPIHPLLESWIKQHFQKLIDDKNIIFLEDVKLNSVPTLSVRSMNIEDSCLKLPAPLQTTHMIRNIPIEEVRLGASFSKIFEKIIKSEGLGKKLLLEIDQLGVAIDHTKVGCSEDYATMLNFVLRKNPKKVVGPENHVIPLAGLLLATPGETIPFIFTIMKKHGAEKKGQQYEYLKEYINNIISIQLELYFKTGLIIEAHQQNLNIVFDKSWNFKCLMYHDIPGGVSAYTPLLKHRHKFSKEMAKDLYFFRDTPERSIMQFIHPTLTAHLLPLASHASAHLGLKRAKVIGFIRKETERQLKLAKSIISKSSEEEKERRLLIKEFRQKVIKNETLPVKRMLERYYLQSMIDGWGKVIPNPEVLSPRVLVPSSEVENSLAIKNRPRVIADQKLEDDLFSW